MALAPLLPTPVAAAVSYRIPPYEEGMQHPAKMLEALILTRAYIGD